MRATKDSVHKVFNYSLANSVRIRFTGELFLIVIQFCFLHVSSSACLSSSLCFTRRILTVAFQIAFALKSRSHYILPSSRHFPRALPLRPADFRRKKSICGLANSLHDHFALCSHKNVQNVTRGWVGSTYSESPMPRLSTHRSLRRYSLR